MAVIDINEDNFKESVGESTVPVIVDFFADWCGPCQMMKPVFEEISSDYDNKLKFGIVDTDKNAKLSTDNNISGIPCLIIFKDGKEFDRIVGYNAKDALKSKIDSILEKMQ